MATRASPRSLGEYFRHCTGGAPTASELDWLCAVGNLLSPTGVESAARKSDGRNSYRCELATAEFRDGRFEFPDALDWETSVHAPRGRGCAARLAVSDRCCSASDCAALHLSRACSTRFRTGCTRIPTATLDCALGIPSEITAVTFGSRPLIPESRLYELLNQRRDNFKHYYRFRAVPSHCRPRASRVMKTERVSANQRPKVLIKCLY